MQVQVQQLPQHLVEGLQMLHQVV
ncbi:hypothetical protein MTR67_035544 [Solanum verrucosum]|uniref:Uncharacterized protein n=1 Tax=Solanum verrucosum TaxID=315347 RepID=A0AAF0UAC9_SOLVR|nr:hypothetical protein MTR67_035544 [Solanum verrucosum]